MRETAFLSLITNLNTTTNNVQQKLDVLLPRVTKPARYIGGEPYQISKKEGEFDIRFAFCFPDTYEIGMSFMGLQLLYHLVNKTKHTFLERVFMPDTDMEEEMRKSNLPLYTLESKTLVKDCDIVGFTLQYELSYTNVLNMLDLAGIPMLTKDRTEDDPIVVAGGPCAFNVEPLADFFDIVMIGDGEELGDVKQCYHDQDKAHKSDDVLCTASRPDRFLIVTIAKGAFDVRPWHIRSFTVLPVDGTIHLAELLLKLFLLFVIIDRLVVEGIVLLLAEPIEHSHNFMHY